MLNPAQLQEIARKVVSSHIRLCDDKASFDEASKTCLDAFSEREIEEFREVTGSAEGVVLHPGGSYAIIVRFESEEVQVVPILSEYFAEY
jgi:hypothetical protein